MEKMEESRRSVVAAANQINSCVEIRERKSGDIKGGDLAT